MSEATTEAPEMTLESYRKQVRAEAIRIAREMSWCDAGLNSTLERLGLPPKGPAYNVPVRYTSLTPHSRSMPVTLPSEMVASLAEAAGTTPAKMVTDYYGDEPENVRDAAVSREERVRVSLPLTWNREYTRLTIVTVDDVESEADARAHVADNLDALATRLGIPRSQLVSAEVPEVKDNPDELVKGDLDTSYDDNYHQCENYSGSFYCTRARGHEGQHVGSNGKMTEVMAVWPQVSVKEARTKKARVKSSV